MGATSGNMAQYLVQAARQCAAGSDAQLPPPADGVGGPEDSSASAADDIGTLTVTM
jgi:hypothetical protein